MRKIFAALFVVGLVALVPVGFGCNAANAAGPVCGIGTSPSCPKAAPEGGVIVTGPRAAPEGGVIVMGGGPRKFMTGVVIMEETAADGGVATGIGTSPSGNDPVANPLEYGLETYEAFKRGAFYLGSLLLLMAAVAWARLKGARYWPALGSGLAAIVLSVVLGAAGSAVAALASGAAGAAIVAAVFAGALKGLEAAGVVRLAQKVKDHQDAKAAS